MIKEYCLASPTIYQEISSDFQAQGGAYKLFFKNDGQIRAIERLLRTDSEGILYIGKATSFVDRIGGLKKTIDPDYKSASHICGRRYNKNVNIQTAFPYNNLFVILIGHDRPKEKETELLNSYFMIFGEVPPLNATG